MARGGAAGPGVLSVEALAEMSFPRDGGQAYRRARGGGGGGSPGGVSQPHRELVGGGRNQKYVRECQEMYLGRKGELPPPASRSPPPHLPPPKPPYPRAPLLPAARLRGSASPKGGPRLAPTRAARAGR